MDTVVCVRTANESTKAMEGTMQIRKILVPVDGSEHARRATVYAAEFAAMVHASVLLVHSRMSIPPLLGQAAYDEVRNSLNARAESLLEPYREILRGAGISFEDRILEGPAETAIVDAVRAEKCDHIILGSRGVSELEGLLLGSVTRRVLQLAPCPVTVVR